MGFEQKKLSGLVKRAIGTRTLSEFISASGLSRYMFEQMLYGGGADAPRKRFLQQVVDASEGRVTREEILASCGYPITESDALGSLSEVDAHTRIVSDTLGRVRERADAGGWYPSISAALDDMLRVYDAVQVERIVVRNPLEGHGDNGNDICALCMVRLAYRSLVSCLSIALSFRRENGGVAVRGCDLDLESLLRMGDVHAQDYLLTMLQVRSFNIPDGWPVFYNNGA